MFIQKCLILTMIYSKHKLFLRACRYSKKLWTSFTLDDRNEFTEYNVNRHH